MDAILLSRSTSLVYDDTLSSKRRKVRPSVGAHAGTVRAGARRSCGAEFP